MHLFQTGTRQGIIEAVRGDGQAEEWGAMGRESGEGFVAAEFHADLWDAGKTACGLYGIWLEKGSLSAREELYK